MCNRASRAESASKQRHRRRTPSNLTHGRITGRSRRERRMHVRRSHLQCLALSTHVPQARSDGNVPWATIRTPAAGKGRHRRTRRIVRADADAHATRHRPWFRPRVRRATDRDSSDPTDRGVRMGHGRRPARLHANDRHEATKGDARVGALRCTQYPPNTQKTSSTRAGIALGRSTAEPSYAMQGRFASPRAFPSGRREPPGPADRTSRDERFRVARAASDGCRNPDIGT